MKFFIVLGGTILAFIIGRRAIKLGKSFVFWFVLSFFITPLFSWIILEASVNDSKRNVGLIDSEIFRRNLILTFILIFILLGLYAFIPGYNYAIKDVAIGNKQRIDQIENRKLNFNLPEITWELKRQFRIEDYWYIQTIQDVTPRNQNTVVLLPPHTAVDSTPQFKELCDPEWMEYFLYPRLCISEDEKNTKKELYARVNYVAVINNWGYDKLKYEPAAHPSDAVLPVDKPAEAPAKAQAPPPAFNKQFWGDSAAKSNTLNQQNQ